MKYLSMCKQKDKLRKSFELLRFDFMIDDKFIPKVMECNMSPSFRYIASHE